MDLTFKFNDLTYTVIAVYKDTMLAECEGHDLILFKGVNWTDKKCTDFIYTECCDFTNKEEALTSFAEKAYRDQQRMYRLCDAVSQLAFYYRVDINDSDVLNKKDWKICVKVEDEDLTLIYTREDLEEIVDRYVRCLDCNIAENDLWQSLIADYESDRIDELEENKFSDPDHEELEAS